MRSKASLVVGAALLWLALWPTAAAAQAVGEVIFAVGDVQAGGKSLGRGDAVQAGQTLVTGSSGHVHIRFVDSAFVSVRPNSQLAIDQYVYDPEHPQNNRVKFTLDHGTSRLITGKAGQAAKQNFRLNTPVAALGVRGTDFVVQAADDVTRVAVQQGAVVLSPFGGDCQASTLGPCGGTLARELAGSLTGNYLELKGQAAPALVVPENGRANRLFAPSRPEEPGVGSKGGDKSAANDSPQQGGQQWLNGSSAIQWGRWSGTAAGLVAPVGYELIGHNDALVLFRALDKIDLPKTGNVDFNLTESQAYGRVGGGGFQAASVNNATLAVNFGTMKYSTRFDWQFNGLSQTFYNKGSISENGRFADDRAMSNVGISGALSGNGSEAGYLFNGKVRDDTQAFGLLRWEAAGSTAGVNFSKH